VAAAVCWGNHNALAIHLHRRHVVEFPDCSVLIAASSLGALCVIEERSIKAACESSECKLSETAPVVKKTTYGLLGPRNTTTMLFGSNQITYKSLCIIKKAPRPDQIKASWTDAESF